MSKGDRFSFPNAAKLLFTRIDNRTLSGRYTSNAETMYNLVAPHAIHKPDLAYRANAVLA
jgi:hypothetical protein